MNHLFPPAVPRLGLVLLLLAACCGGSGCQKDRVATEPSEVKPAPAILRLLVVDDPELAKVIKREWEARAEGELQLRESTSQEVLQSDARRLNADAIVYPAELLGELAERGWLAPLPKDRLDDPTYLTREIFPAVRKHDTAWEEESFAVPLGNPPLVLFYHQELFTKLSLKPPQTWEAYQQIAGQIASRDSVKDHLAEVKENWGGVCEPLEEEWAAQLLLARAAAYGKHRSQFSALFDYSTMTPLISSPPFVRALTELAETAKAGPRDGARLRPAETVQRLRAGECGMAIGWLAADAATASADQAEPSTPASSIAVGVAPLPGSRDVYNFRSEGWEERSSEEGLHVPLVGIAGRVASLTQESREPGETIRLLMWLSGPEMGAQVAAASRLPAPFRDLHVAQPESWAGPLLQRGGYARETLNAYAEAVQQSLHEPNCLVGLRIPGRREYLQALAEGVHRVLDGQQSAEAALKEVAGRWEAITAKHGKEQQRLAYARSIGLRP